MCNISTLTEHHKTRSVIFELHNDFDFPKLRPEIFHRIGSPDLTYFGKILKTSEVNNKFSQIWSRLVPVHLNYIVT